MSAKEIMALIREEPEEVIDEFGAMFDEWREQLVDEKLEAAVRAGAFDDLAAAALKEHIEGKTMPLDEFLAQH